MMFLKPYTYEDAIKKLKGDFTLKITRNPGEELDSYLYYDYKEEQIYDESDNLHVPSEKDKSETWYEFVKYREFKWRDLWDQKPKYGEHILVRSQNKPHCPWVDIYHSDGFAFFDIDENIEYQWSYIPFY